MKARSFAGRGAGPGIWVALLLAGCKADPQALAPSPPAAAPPATGSPPARKTYGPDPDALPEVADPRELEPGRRAIQVVHDVERVVDGELARAAGLTLVDLRDDWAPPIFDDAQDAQGHLLINRYRQVFVGLANDRTDGDGEPIEPGVKNYLELFGIPPSLSVLRERFLADEGRDCSGVDNEALAAVDRITVWSLQSEREELAKEAARRKRLDKAMATAGVQTLDELVAADPRHERDVAACRQFEAERRAFAAVEQRLLCEGRMAADKHVPGSYDFAMRAAVVAFQEEHMLLDRTEIQQATLRALMLPPQVGNFAALRRTIAERAAAAGRILEDGSVDLPPARDGTPRGPFYETSTGQKRPVPNLVEAATEATMARLGLDSPEAALAFFKRHPPSDFTWLQVAVRFPELPDYYGPHMDLSVEIDRGDVWYEFPFDKTGKRLPQPRRVLPSLTVYVTRKGKRIPLVKWRTTIGGWRSEMASDGHDYLRYKISDVGPRVWRHVVASPVWIPPESSPLSGMSKQKWVNGKRQWVTNYDEVGPGYLSAYGLAMAIHVEQRKHPDGRVTFFDNGIRTHGSSDYRSLRGRFSHGCHRLYNNLAVRLFDFVLAHRRHRVLGPIRLDFQRRFLRDDKVFEMRLPVRGFYYELDPPLPTETLEGNVRGDLKKPIDGYVMKPGVIYPSARPPAVNGGGDKAGGGAAAAENDV